MQNATTTLPQPYFRPPETLSKYSFDFYCFWISVAPPWAPSGLPFASLWLPLASLLALFGTLWLPLGSHGAVSAPPQGLIASRGEISPPLAMRP